MTAMGGVVQGAKHERNSHRQSRQRLRRLALYQCQHEQRSSSARRSTPTPPTSPRKDRRRAGQYSGRRTYEARCSRQSKTAFGNKYFNQTTGASTSPTQCTYALALQFNLLPGGATAEGRAVARERRDRQGEQTLDRLRRGGAFAAQPSSNNGKLATAHKLLQQDRLSIVAFLGEAGRDDDLGGAGTDGLRPAASRTSRDEFLQPLLAPEVAAKVRCLNSVAGIDIDPTTTGYTKILIRPQPGGTITSAKRILRLDQRYDHQAQVEHGQRRIRPQCHDPGKYDSDSLGYRLPMPPP